jgi:CubicO group peptidase (beta-lactamase class C family)
MNTVSPESVGLSAERLARIRPAIQSFVDREKIAGAITLVARQGKIAHLECTGQMDVEAGKPMQPDTIFRIYSMTKPITSVAMLMLLEEGRFLLTDPVSKFIPAFKHLKVHTSHAAHAELEREPTILNLMTHTSGLGYGLFTDSPVEDHFRQSGLLAPMGKLRVPLAELGARVATLPLAHQPGTRWRYSIASDLLGALVEHISGIAFDAFLDERIFKPLGMVDTGFHVPAEKVDRFAACYTPAVPAAPGGVPLPAGSGATHGGLMLVDAPATSPYLKAGLPPSGGGGLVSTTTDYLRFAQMLLNWGEAEGVRLLSRKTVELMTANHLPEAFLPFKVGIEPVLGSGFGLGVSLRISDESGLLGSEGMFGWNGAAGTFVRIDPYEEMVILYMPQLLAGTELICPVFQNLAYQAITD